MQSRLGMDANILPIRIPLPVRGSIAPKAPFRAVTLSPPKADEGSHSRLEMGSDLERFFVVLPPKDSQNDSFEESPAGG